ncbi:hypothetical protein [Propionivibrio sp.]|uniref:hypothetical protein n=1 Tax=Propionivibrio sp. TaxID=2212460 RepID=UPI003BF404D7
MTKNTKDSPNSPSTAEGQRPGGNLIAVSARQAGFRRAGRAWSVEPTIVSTDEFTREQLMHLAHEPMLAVVRCADTEA